LQAEDTLRARKRLAAISPAMTMLFMLHINQAWADAIDGDWCQADGRRLSIDGPKLVTPGGKHMLGNYDRHGFEYVAPVQEQDAGATITMVLRNENLMEMTTPSVSRQAWRRCGKPVS
jgi:hypothetical protein